MTLVSFFQQPIGKAILRNRTLDKNFSLPSPVIKIYEYDLLPRPQRKPALSYFTPEGLMFKLIGNNIGNNTLYKYVTVVNYCYLVYSYNNFKSAIISAIY